MSNFKQFYFISLSGSLIASFYPIYMGIIALTDYIRNGAIGLSNYPKYIIPYTPICIALILTIALMPVIYRLFRRFAMPAAVILALGLFFASELCLENMIVMNGPTKYNIKSWQYLSCLMTPEVYRTIGDPLTGGYNPAFKIHFYIISAVILLAVVNVIYGFSGMIRENDYSRKRPLTIQAVSAAVFIGLCIYACFTAFYRTGTILIPPLSAALMGLFFIVFGVTAGTFTGSLLYFKPRVFSVILPAAASMLTTVVMYIGELVLMGGRLFRFGRGFLFEPLGAIPFSFIDLIIIMVSGAVTYLIMELQVRGASEAKKNAAGE